MLLNLIAGLLLGLFSGSLYFVLHALELLRTASAGQLFWAAVICHGVILLLVLWRQRSADPRIGFARLLASGLMVSLIGALITGLGVWLFVSFVDPTFIDWLREQSLARLDQLGLSEDQRSLQEAQIRSADKGNFVTQAVMAVLFRGFLFSLPLAALLRLRAARKD